MKKKSTVFFGIVVLLVFFSGIYTGCSRKNKGGSDNSLEKVLKRGIFLVGVDDNLPPLCFRDENDTLSGYDVDFIKEVSLRLGTAFEIQPISESNGLSTLKTGNVDCLWDFTPASPADEGKLALTKPYLYDMQVFVVKTDSPVKTPGDLSGRIIGVQKYSYALQTVGSSDDFGKSGNFTKQNYLIKSLASVVQFDDITGVLKALENTKVDAIVMDSIIADYFINKTEQPFRVLDTGLSKQPYTAAFRKNDLQLRNRVQRIIESMNEDGTIAGISVKWFGCSVSEAGE